MDVRAILLGLAFAVMWSSAFTSARVIVAHAPPLSALALRFLISGLIGVAIARAAGASLRLDRVQWGAVIVFGVCQNALYLGLNFVGMQTVEASVAAIIASTMPLLVGAAAWTLLGERLSPLGIGGLVAGFAGAAVILLQRLSGGGDPLGLTLCGLGAVALTVATLAARRAAGGSHVMGIVGLQMLVGAAVLAPAALALETLHVDLTWQLGVAFAYTLVVPGLMATWVWFTLVGRIGPTRAATFHFLNPFLGVALAAVLLGEPLTWRDATGVAIIAAGIFAVQWSRVQRRVGAPGQSSK